MTYRALPEGLFIRSSPIAGQGIFSRNSMNEGTELGMSHIINHSDLPNCEKYQVDNRYYIKVIRPVGPMEELFLKYTFYNV